MLRDIVFGTGTQNLILDLAAILVKLGLLLLILIFFQQLYTRISKNSAEGHPQETKLIFRAILSAFALLVLALNWLPWLYTGTVAHNAFDLIVNEGQYFLLIPLLVVIAVVVQTWREKPNAPASVAVLLAAYAITVLAIGLPSRAYASATEVGSAWLSLIVAGIGVFPAVLYAEGMPHPTNRLLYLFINFGKVSYDEAVHYAAQELSVQYSGSTVPLGFSLAEGDHQGRHIKVFGSEGSDANNRIVMVMTSGIYAVDDIIINRPSAWPEIYLEALGSGVPQWYGALLDDEGWQPAVENIEIEIGGMVITDEYEVASVRQKKALEIVAKLRERIIDLDADFIAINKDCVYVGYDFSRMRMPVEFIVGKAKLQLVLADALEQATSSKKEEKKATSAQKSAKSKAAQSKQTKAKDTTAKSAAKKESAKSKAATGKTASTSTRKKSTSTKLPETASS